MDAERSKRKEELAASVQVNRIQFCLVAFVDTINLNIPLEIMQAIKQQDGNHEKPLMFKTFIVNHSGTHMRYILSLSL